MNQLALPGLPSRPGSGWVGWPPHAGPASPLRQCLTLALLLHVLLVLVFGNTEGGSAQRGQGVWGAMNVRLAGGDAAGQPEATVAADAYSGPLGQARERRFGGSVRDAKDPPQAHAQPGAARQGPWQPQPQPQHRPRLRLPHRQRRRTLCPRHRPRPLPLRRDPCPPSPLPLHPRGRRRWHPRRQP